jgi:DNA repair protein SbcD/Mre11
MRILHTADWHVGKVLKGHSRLDEQRAVMAEMVALVERESIDVVLVAGDVFDVSVPTPDAQHLAWTTLLGFRQHGAEVVVVAGNHDSAESFDALSSLFAAAGVTVVGRPRSPSVGGVLRFNVGTKREPLRLALLPFVSQRGSVRAADLLELDAAQARGQYADRLGAVVERLTADFSGDAVNMMVAHATISGAGFGGGEREAHSIFDYHLPALTFPSTAGYVALGHLHRQQLVPGPCPIWYSGSPIVVDFGEGENRGGALIVDAAPGRPVKVESVEFESARRLITITGTVEQLVANAAALSGEPLIRAIVTEQARAGLAEEVRSAIANVLEVRIERPAAVMARGASSREGRTPSELFRQYLDTKSVADPDVERMFAELLDEVQPGADASTAPGGTLF